jgi:hypothetical protein
MPERRRGVRAVDRDRGTWWQALAVRSLLLRLAALALLIVAYVAVKRHLRFTGKLGTRPMRSAGSDNCVRL